MTNWSPDVKLRPIPAWLSAVVDAALADLQQPTAIDIRLDFEGPGTLWVSEASWLGKVGFQAHEDEGVYLLVEFADWLQEQFFLESKGAWGEARPACPGHPHSAQATELGGEAWWVCPAGGPRVAMIGHFGRWDGWGCRCAPRRFRA